MHDVLLNQLFFAFRKVEIFHFMFQHVPRIFTFVVVAFPFIVFRFDVVFSNIRTFLHPLGDVRDHRLHGGLDWLLIYRGRKRCSCSAGGWHHVRLNV